MNKVIILIIFIGACLGNFNNIKDSINIYLENKEIKELNKTKEEYLDLNETLEDEVKEALYKTKSEDDWEEDIEESKKEIEDNKQKIEDYQNKNQEQENINKEVSEAL